MKNDQPKPPGKGGIAMFAAAILAVSGTWWGREEGIVLHSYPDPIWGWAVPTACIGETGRHIQPGQDFTLQQCVDMLDKRLRPKLVELDQCVTRPVTFGTALALLSIADNVGVQRICGSTMVRQINAGAAPVAYCEQFRSWVYAAGRDCRKPESKCSGLVARRERERAMCLGIGA